MIDYIKSAELNNCSVDELKIRFEKFPKSNKRIIAICNNCKLEREIIFNDYTDFCHPCAMKSSKIRKSARLKTIEQFSDPDMRDAARSRSINQWSDPKSRLIASKSAIKRWSNQDYRDEQSVRITNSEAAKIATENQRGGNDIVEHHYIYDESDRSKYTMPISRSLHSALHRTMEKFGIEVPHINVVV